MRKELIINRKDNKRRVLKEGESQRKNLTYMYRYTDIDGVRRSVYAKTLNDLREKEKQILIALSRNESLFTGKIKVIDLVEEYYKTKKNLKIGTQIRYESYIEIIRDSKIAKIEIKDLKPSLAKNFFVDLYESGIGYSSLVGMRNNILFPAFKQAYEEEYILRNPFDFVCMIKNLLFKPKNNWQIKNLRHIYTVSYVIHYVVIYVVLHKRTYKLEYNNTDEKIRQEKSCLFYSSVFTEYSVKKFLTISYNSFILFSSSVIFSLSTFTLSIYSISSTPATQTLSEILYQI